MNKRFKIKDLFLVSGTKTTSLEDLNEKGKGRYPYVTTQSSNNGVAGFYDYYTEDGNVLTVDSAVAGYCSYREEKFSASDHVEKLTPLFKMNKFIGLYFATVINANQYRFSYGRKANQKKISELEIELPIKIDGTPDYDFMENYIKSLWGGSHTTSIQYSNIDLKIEKWKEFELQELFEIKYGVNLELINLTQSTCNQAINFVSRTGVNNGVVAKVLPVEGIEPQEAGLISVASGGSVLSTFYQDEPFYSGRDLYVLKEKVLMSKLTKLFLCTLIKKNAYRYAYGRQANKTLKNIIVKVPVDSKGVIDDKYITNFMSKLQYSDMI